LLATAHTWRGGDGPYTLAPMVGLILTLILIRSILRLPLGIPAFVASVALGSLFASVVDAWGFTLTVSTWIVSASLAGAALRSARRSFGGNLSD
jgi:hypothetical protein